MEPTVRKQKSGDQLVVGDWLAPEELTEGAAEVLFAYSYPASADGSRDNEGKHVQLVLREQGSTVTEPMIVAGNHLVTLASAEDLAALRQQAERAQKIADLRAMADFLASNPWMPLPWQFRGQYGMHGDPATDIATVRALAERVGVKVDDHLDDRTVMTFEVGAHELCVVAWHDGGRPAEPVADPTGLLHCRADDADDPTPVSPARVPMRSGAMTKDGLVDETEVDIRVCDRVHVDAWAGVEFRVDQFGDEGVMVRSVDGGSISGWVPLASVRRIGETCTRPQSAEQGLVDETEAGPLHHNTGGEFTACGLVALRIPPGHGLISVREHVTCPNCIAEIRS